MTRREIGRAILAVVLLQAATIPARAADIVAPPVISPPDSWVPRQAGVLRILNKIDSTVRSLDLKVGQTAQVQTLSITLRACAVRPDDLPRDAAARLLVSDSRQGAPDVHGTIFDGWILQNEPAANMLEHPVYDIQLAGCS